MCPCYTSMFAAYDFVKQIKVSEASLNGWFNSNAYPGLQWINTTLKVVIWILSIGNMT